MDIWKKNIKSVKNKRTVDEKIDRIVGHNLRTIRIRKGLSQQALGDVIGVSFQQIQKYETGRNRVSASTLYKLSMELDVGIIDFFAGTQVNNQALSKITREEVEFLQLYSSLPSDRARKDMKGLLKQWASCRG